MTESPVSTTNLETELTLLVVAHDVETFRESFAAIEHVGPFAVGAVETLSIEDVYLDTPAGDLSRQWWVLRVRNENCRTYVTLKGPTQRTAWGGSQRVEIEEPWSQESAERALATISRTCPGIGPFAVMCGDACAEETLKRCGFVERQRRQTLRDRRTVVIHSDGSPGAELVLDRVTYRFSQREVRHAEIEIEAVDSARAECVKEIADILLATFGDALRQWEFGKTATGTILQRWLLSGELEPLIGPNHYLVPAAYALMESLLRNR
jgi:hypothetical protein